MVQRLSLRYLGTKLDVFDCLQLRVMMLLLKPFRAKIKELLLSFIAITTRLS